MIVNTIDWLWSDGFGEDMRQVLNGRLYTVGCAIQICVVEFKWYLVPQPQGRNVTPYLLPTWTDFGDEFVY